MRRAAMGLMAFIYTSLSFAGPDVIIPSKAIDNLFYLYKDYSIVNDEVNVTGQSFLRTGPNSLTHVEKGHKAKIPFSSFSFYRYLGASVFRAQSGTGTSSGTASLIGKNLVLTNQHVLATDNTKKECGKFQVYLDDEEKQAVTCKQVLYCDTQDFCLAEMKPYQGKELSEIVRPISLKTTQETKAKKLIIVGNAFGLGIQGSSGKEYKYVKKNDIAYGYRFDENVLIHHTPTLSGSSGSPVFNEQGEMVGLNYANNSRKGYVDDNANNLAVPSPYILSQLKKNISKEHYDSISTDQVIPQKTISDYEGQLEESFEIEKNVKISDSLMLEALKTNSLGKLHAEINEQVQSIKASRLSILSIRELDYLKTSNAIPEVAQINQANSILTDWSLRGDAESNCHRQKDLTLDCKQEFILTKFKTLDKVMSLDKKQLKSIIQSRVKLGETSVHDVLNFVRSDKILFLNIFKKCLQASSKISQSSDILFYDNSSSVYYGHKACPDILISEIRATGLKWTANIGEAKDVASLIGANSPLSGYQDSFEKAIASKWKFGLLGKSGKKEVKVKNNKDALNEWLKTLPAPQDSPEWFDIINPRMRKSIL
jgi:V8-like Glu-specific endopeptidase